MCWNDIRLKTWEKWRWHPYNWAERLLVRQKQFKLWARSFWAFSPYLNHLRKFSIPYYQKVVNLPFFVTEKTQTKAFTMIYKQKVVVLPLFVTFPFSRSPKKWHYLSQTFSQEETMAIVFIQIGFWWNVWETKSFYAYEYVFPNLLPHLPRLL